MRESNVNMKIPSSTHKQNKSQMLNLNVKKALKKHTAEKKSKRFVFDNQREKI